MPEIRIQYDSGANDENMFVEADELDRLQSALSENLAGKGETTIQLRFRKSQQEKLSSKTIVLGKVETIEELTEPEPRKGPTMHRRNPRSVS